MNLDFPDMNPTGRSPRRELQGPRPTPLRINKDSHKIRKPPLAPSQPSHPPPQPPPRQPIIIYTVSPKIIHTTPGDFMSLVQRLTGSSSSSSSSSYASLTSSSTNFPPPSDVGPNNDTFCTVGDIATGIISPAARYATVEKARSPLGKKLQNNPMGGEIIGEVEGVDMTAMMMGNHGTIMERTNSMFQGILSPGPASLSPIPSSFFSPSPSSDPSMISFLHDLSPAFHSNNRSNNFMDGISFIMPSPSNFVSPQSFDLFNIFLD